MKATLGSFRSEATYPHACSQHAHASEFSSLEYQRCLCCKLAGVEPKFRSRHCIEECAHVKLWIQGLGMARQRDGERATLDLLAAAIHHGGFIHLCRGAAFGKIPGTRFLIQSSMKPLLPGRYLDGFIPPLPQPVFMPGASALGRAWQVFRIKRGKGSATMNIWAGWYHTAAYCEDKSL